MLHSTRMVPAPSQQGLLGSSGSSRVLPHFSPGGSRRQKQSFGLRQVWVSVPASPFISCVTLDRSLNLSERKCFYLSDGANATFSQGF